MYWYQATGPNLSRLSVLLPFDVFEEHWLTGRWLKDLVGLCKSRTVAVVEEQHAGERAQAEHDDHQGEGGLGAEHN